MKMVLSLTGSCLLFVAAPHAQSQLKLTGFYDDGIIYQTNEISKASSNCEIGFCKKKVVEDEGKVYWIVLPECDSGHAELSKQKYK